VVVRAVAPVITHKLEDPAVVVVDVGGRWAVSLLSGHEGGANELAVTVGNILAAEPVISTSTEALKDLIVGVGCRRGTAAARIEQAVRQVLDTAGLPLSRVRYLASADLKKTEAGLLAAAQALGVPLRFISSSELRTTVRADFTPSAVAKAKVGLPAVAEPVALLAGRRTELFVPRQIVDGVTVAVARERCMWSA
jgi:cobalt-precorrin 5A hydrolase